MRFLGYEINLSLSIRRVKTIILNIPNNADDVHIRNGEIKGLKIFDPDWGLTPDSKPKLCYYSNLLSGVSFVDLPEKTKEAKITFLTPRTKIINNKKVNTKNRICIVKCYL